MGKGKGFSCPKTRVWYLLIACCVLSFCVLFFSFLVFSFCFFSFLSVFLSVFSFGFSLFLFLFLLVFMYFFLSFFVYFFANHCGVCIFRSSHAPALFDFEERCHGLGIKLGDRCVRK